MINTLINKKTGVLAIGLLFAALALLPAFATAQPGGGNEDCNIGYTLLEKYEWEGGQYKLDDTDGTTVSVSGDKKSGTFEVIDSDYLVYQVIVKGSNDAESDLYPGGVSSGSFSNTILPKPGASPNYPDISNIKFCGKKKTAPEPQGDTFRFVKKWDGDVDQVDLDKVEVVFKVGAFEWRIGDAVVPVEPGDVLTPLSETVTGLPLNCSYESDLPSSYTVPGNENGENNVKKDRKDKKRGDHRKRGGDSRQVSAAAAVNGTNGVVEGQLYELVVTNTIDCEDTKPVVPQDDEEPKKEVVTTVAPREVTQVVAPVGAVDAGVGAVAHVAGLFASLTAVGAGLVSRKLKL
jgi:hypothetical protein